MTPTRESIKERNLWQVYQRYLHIKVRRTNVYITITVFILACTALTIIWAQSRSIVGFGQFVTNVLAPINSAGLLVAVSLLGFLIAGFTIFASLTRPGLFREMDAIFYEGQLTAFEYTILSFMGIFIHYFIFTGLCSIGVVLFAKVGGTTLLQKVAGCAYEIVAIVSSVFFIIFCSYFAYILVLLKSFIYNIYQAVLFIVRIDET